MSASLPSVRYFPDESHPKPLCVSHGLGVNLNYCLFLRSVKEEVEKWFTILSSVFSRNTNVTPNPLEHTLRTYSVPITDFQFFIDLLLYLFLYSIGVNPVIL